MVAGEVPEAVPGKRSATRVRLPATDDAEFLGSDAYLRAIASQLGPPDAGTAVPARIVDGPRVLLDGPVPFASLLRTHARVHIPAHAVEVIEQALTRTG